MDPSKLRIAIEVLFLNIGGEDLQEDCVSVISDALCEVLDGDDDAQQDYFYNKFVVFFGKVPGDFIDDNGNRRLRLKTICEITGLKYSLLTPMPYKDLDIRGADALDFLILCTRRIEEGGMVADDVLSAKADLDKYVPPQKQKTLIPSILSTLTH